MEDFLLFLKMSETSNKFWILPYNVRNVKKTDFGLLLTKSETSNKRMWFFSLQCQKLQIEGFGLFLSISETSKKNFSENLTQMRFF